MDDTLEANLIPMFHIHLLNPLQLYYLPHQHSCNFFPYSRQARILFSSGVNSPLILFAEGYTEMDYNIRISIEIILV